MELALVTVSTETLTSNTSVKVYPNPVNEVVTFELQSLSGRNTLEIFDVSGKLLIQKQIDSSGASTENVSLAFGS